MLEDIVYFENIKNNYLTHKKLKSQIQSFIDANRYLFLQSYKDIKEPSKKKLLENYTEFFKKDKLLCKSFLLERRCNNYLEIVFLKEDAESKKTHLEIIEVELNNNQNIEYIGFWFSKTLFKLNSQTITINFCFNEKEYFNLYVLSIGFDFSVKVSKEGYVIEYEEEDFDFNEKEHLKEFFQIIKCMIEYKETNQFQHFIDMCLLGKYFQLNEDFCDLLKLETDIVVKNNTILNELKDNVFD